MDIAQICVRRAALVGALAFAASGAAAQTIYFADIFVPDFSHGSIRRISADGSGLETLFEVGGGLRGFDIDLAAGKIYWTDVNVPAIRRANLDGSGVETVLSSVLTWPPDVLLNVAADTMYFGDQVEFELSRAALDGSGHVVLRSTAFHTGIAADLLAGKLYWSTSPSMFFGDIVRTDLAGANLETVITNSGKPARLAVDPAGGWIYWTDYVVDVVRRGRLDGSQVQDLYFVGANFNPRGIALDLEHGLVYWGQDIDFDGTGGRLMRMGLDGFLPETVADGLGQVNDLFIVPADAACYADCNADGALNIFDFLCFQGKVTTGDPTADCNGDGSINIFDFLCFQGAVTQGC
jgi:hypothetical protein